MKQEMNLTDLQLLHQEKIRKSNKYSALDSVMGIGPITKALLKEFKSLKGIKEASKDDLMTIKI